MSRTRSMLEHGNPMGENTTWPVIALEGILLVGLGIFVLVNQARAASAILQIIALVLLVASVMAVVTEFRVGSTAVTLFSAFRSGLGVAIGGIGTARWFWDYIGDGPLRLILGWGLLAHTAVSIAGIIAGRESRNISLGGAGIMALTAALGVILLVTDDATSSGTLRLLGFAFLIGGVLLGGIAFMRYRSNATPS